MRIIDSRKQEKKLFGTDNKYQDLIRRMRLHIGISEKTELVYIHDDRIGYIPFESTILIKNSN